MKRIGRKNMKIIAATAMTIFSLFATTVGVFAWFTSKLTQANEADQFNVTVLDGKLKNIYFHQMASKVLNPDTTRPISFTFESNYCGKISYNWRTATASYSGDTSIELDDYSPLDAAHPLLLVFELDKAYDLVDDGDIIISAMTSVEYFLGERGSNNAALHNLEQDFYYSEPNAQDSTKTDYYYALSSVANFYCSDTSSELYNKSNNENITLINTTYTVANMQDRESAHAAKQSNPDANVPDLSFTFINNADDSTSFNQEPLLYTSSANTTVKYISVIVDYYADAVEYIYSTYLGNAVLEDEFDSELHFLCDWGLEIR